MLKFAFGPLKISTTTEVSCLQLFSVVIFNLTRCCPVFGKKCFRVSAAVSIGLKSSKSHIIETKESLERNVNLNALTNRPFDLESDELGEFSYKISDTQSIKFTWPLTDTTTGKVSDELKLAIREVNGKRDVATIDQFIRYEFLSIDAKKFRKYMYDNMPGLDFNYEFESDDKGTFTALFRVGTDLFWF